MTYNKLAGILACGVCIAAMATPANAQNAPYNIPAGSLKSALDAYGRQAGRPIIYKEDQIRGLRSRGASGSMSSDAALDSILSGTPFKGQADSSGAIAIVRMGNGTAAANQEAPPPEEVASEDSPGQDIVVTGSRIERAGFDQPTPVVVLGQAELQRGDRPNLQAILNDQPQFRASVTPSTTAGNEVSAGTAPADLRGLGPSRTLTLLNGRRFVGDNNLNYIPTNLIKTVEVVTGGASAAWGSGAVAGVVNITLNDKLEGITLSANTGISSRGDANRYGVDGSFGTSFADGAGHFMIGAEYLSDKGIADRNSRPNVGSSGIVPAPGGKREVVEDLNMPGVSLGGVIVSGILAGQTFNPDGTLRPFRGPDARGVGGEDGIGLTDRVYAAGPFDRLSTYARVSYDIGNATLWLDGTYGRAKTDYPFFPDFLTGGALGPLTIQADNPFLSSDIRGQLAAAGETSFSFGRFFADPYMTRFVSDRQNMVGAIGVDGGFGDSWKYHAHFSHGVIKTDRQIPYETLSAAFGNAINAVSSGGQIVCGINADANPANDDPSCSPINPFGQGNVSQAAFDYSTGTERSFSTTKLDSAGAQLQGDLFELWAGPLTIAIGAEARWEETKSHRTPETINGGFIHNLFTGDLSGGFNVQEGFAEVALPLIKIENKVELDFNGAARYSHYSNSGGIWSWKLGGTARLFDDILLRVTRSRDIRSPSITELFSERLLTIGSAIDDPRLAPANPGPGYNPNPALVSSFTGGNPDLVPEIASTLTFGATVSPSFLRGFRASVDYYDISIDGAITSLSRNQVIAGCANGGQSACDQIIRDSSGTITTIYSGYQNIAKFKTSGIDFEASYIHSLLGGSLRLRALATYVDKFIYDDGLSRINSAGDVGSTANAIPKWRGNVSIGYDHGPFGGNVRVRYVDGGNYNSSQTNFVVSELGSRTYVDLGVKFDVSDHFTFYGNVDNLFDSNAPLGGSRSIYEIMGTYYTAGVKLRF